MRLEIKTHETFIPEWNGNKQLAPEEQVVFTYKTPTMQIRKKIVAKTIMEFKYDRDGVVNGGVGKIDMDEEAPIRSVQNLVIQNLEYTLDGQTKYIRSGSDLLSAPAVYHGLIVEFAEHLREKASEEVPEKN